jgi:hypothetical protein
MTATESCAKLTVVKAATRCNARVAALLFAALLFDGAEKKSPGLGAGASRSWMATSHSRQHH